MVTAAMKLKDAFSFDHNIRGRVTHEDDVNAGLIDDRGHRVVVCCKHRNLLASLFHLKEAMCSYFAIVFYVGRHVSLQFSECLSVLHVSMCCDCKGMFIFWKSVSFLYRKARLSFYLRE